VGSTGSTIANTDLYQGRGGMSRGYLVVRQGALNSDFEFLAATPPNTVRGKVTTAQIRMMTTMVPKGRAAVDLC
jgi:hypothetical protein